MTLGQGGAGLQPGSHNSSLEAARSLKPSGKGNPCPICGRTKDGDCRTRDDLVICHRGSDHHPPEGLQPGDVIDGNDGQRWAFTGDTTDGRAATFTLDKPRAMASPQMRTAPQGVEIARLPEPSRQPPDHLPDGKEIPYSDTQWVQVRRTADGQKKHLPWHKDADGNKVNRSGSTPWPLWKESEALKIGSGRWIAEAEGEKCAQWLRAGGLVAVSQPGHDRKLASIEARYRRLKEGGVLGVVYLADNDQPGRKKGETCAAAAAAVGLRLLLIQATDVWHGLPEGGSIDDAPGTAAERVAALLAVLPEALKRTTQARPKDHPVERSAAVAAGGTAVRLSPAQVLEMLPARVGMPRLNTRSQAITAGDRVMSGNTAARLYLELSNAGETWPKDSTYDAVLLLAERNAFDPVADYLNSNTAVPLPMDQWQRLDRCLLGIDDPIAARFLPRYLIAAVARTFEPGCDFRQSPVLVGPQWIGKTALGRILFGAEHFISGIGKQDKESQARCHHAWGVELAELDGITRRSDQEGLKAFLSETCDVFRRPYDKVDERHPRRFLFWGTSNGAALSDTTGNTRFVCIPIRQALPLDWAVQNRDAIWSRAVEQYKAGADWQQCDQEERDAIADRNDSYQQEDPWLMPVQQYLDHCEAEQRLPVQVRDLLARVGVPEERRGTREAKRVRSLAESLGWAVERRSIAGNRVMGLWPAATPLPQPATPLPQPATPPNASQDNGSDPAATAATPKQKELKTKEMEAPAAAAPAPTPPAHANCSRFGVAAVANRPDASQADGSSGVAVVWQWCGSSGSAVAATPTITGLELPPPPVGSGADVDGPDDWPDRQRVA